MTEGSAHVYILTFLDMLSGDEYKRTINADGTDYFLENIFKDYGIGKLELALTSVKKHLRSNENPQLNIWEILEKHTKIIESSNTYDALLVNFEKQVSLSIKDAQEIRLTRLKTNISAPKETEVTIKIYTRNPDVVAEVLNRAKGICEKCKNPAPFIRSKDNTPFLEVHHIKQLAKGGLDTVINALALCPNCHRELHYGIKT